MKSNWPVSPYAKENGGHTLFTVGWFKYQAQQISRLELHEAAARLYRIAEAYKNQG